MTQHILALNNYLTKPLEIVVDVVKIIFSKMKSAQMRKAIRVVRDHMMRHKAYRNTYNELSKLSDAELRDIGISRSEIHWIAMEAHYDNR